MPRPKPLCAKCGVAHYNFVACDQADVANATEAANAAARAEADANRAAQMGHVNSFAGSKLKNFRVLGGTFGINSGTIVRAREDGRDRHGWG
jgi:hypothetical protein